MVGVFKEDVFEHLSDYADWLIEADNDEPLTEAFRRVISRVDKKRLELWRSNPQKQWRIEAEKQPGISRLSVHLAARLDDFDVDIFDTFSNYVEYVKMDLEDVADLNHRAAVEEIAEAVATLGDVLDISVPERQAAFIIQRFEETRLPTPVVWRICRHIACKEKGRVLKPATFEPYLETADERIHEVQLATNMSVLVYKSFDEALAYCLEKEPSLNCDAAAIIDAPSEDINLNSGKAGG